MESMTLERREHALRAVERATEVPMLLLSALMLPLLLGPFFFDLSAALQDGLLLADWAIWGVFAIELGVKTYLSPVRAAYLRRHWFDVLIVVLPFLRPLRILRSTRLMRIVGAMRIFSFTARATDSARAVLVGHGLQYALLIGLLLMVACAGLVTLFEKDSTGEIQRFDDALWWGITTITTVGYGDLYPVTPEGKGIAAFLMLVGISMFSLLTANIAAFLSQPKEKDTATLEEVLATLKRLEASVEELQARAPLDPEAASGAELPLPEELRVHRS
jgi:voltage-gated potassium channel